MTTSRRPDGTLVVRAHDVAWLWIAGALLIGAVLVLSLPLSPTKGSPVLGAGAMAIIAVAALAAYEDRVAEFRSEERCVHWTRRTLVRRERGTLRYAGITAVELVERRHRGSRTYGLVLLTGGRRFALHGSTRSGRARYEAAGRAIAAALREGDGRDVPFVG